VDVSYTAKITNPSSPPNKIKEVDALSKNTKKILDLRYHRNLPLVAPLSIEEVEKRIYDAEDQENRRLFYVTLTRAVHHCRVFIALPKDHSKHAVIASFLKKNHEDLFVGRNASTPVNRALITTALMNILPPLAQDLSLSIDFELASEHIDQSKITKQGIATQALAMQPHPKPSNPHFLKTSFTTLASLLKQEDSDVSLLISEDIPEINADIIYQQGLIDQQQNFLNQIQALKLHHIHSSFRSVTSIRGASLGNLIHLIFEKIDYQKTSEAELFPQIKNLLKVETQSLSETEQKNICSAILQVLTTPLGTITNDLMLSDLSFLDRSNEMRFEIKIPDGQCVTAEHLNHLLSIDFENDSFFNAQNSGRFALFPKDFKFTGLIKGVIDLCFKDPSSDQFFVVDFKSNYLDFFKGSPNAHQIPAIINYHPSLLKDAMIDQLYFLQVLIYLLALHRLLKHTLAKRYIPQDHLGGIMFLFVRGMVGLKSRIDPNTVLGIFEYKPSLACLQAIDLLFENPKAYEQQYMNQVSKG
jgi:ATP-dependent exoDNAse (exonuclease V) beta subunit